MSSHLISKHSRSWSTSQSQLKPKLNFRRILDLCRAGSQHAYAHSSIAAPQLLSIPMHSRQQKYLSHCRSDVAMAALKHWPSAVESFQPKVAEAGWWPFSGCGWFFASPRVCLEEGVIVITFLRILPTSCFQPHESFF